MKLRQREKKKARIEMIPLIDVTFLLLVFFIYISMSMSLSRGIQVLLPKAASSQPQKEKHIAISIDRNGDCYVDKHRVRIEALAGVLRSRIEESGEIPVHIFGDQRVPYKRIVQVLDKVRQSGLRAISLETGELEEVR
jgi:biopolymer transport protein ExbD